MRRSGGTLGRSPSAARSSPGVHRLHHVAALCFTPSACTSPMSTARASACTSPSSAPPPLRDRCKMLDAINDAARSTTPVSTASFVSRFRALRLRLALRRCPPLARASCRGAAAGRPVDDIGGVHRHGVTLGLHSAKVAKWSRYFNRDDRCFLRRRREI